MYFLLLGIAIFENIYILIRLILIIEKKNNPIENYGKIDNKYNNWMFNTIIQFVKNKNEH